VEYQDRSCCRYSKQYSLQPNNIHLATGTHTLKFGFCPAELPYRPATHRAGQPPSTEGGRAVGLCFVSKPKLIARVITAVAFSPTYAVSRLFFVRWISVGEGVPFPRLRIRAVHGTVPRQCACSTLPTRSGILDRPALGELRCRPLPTSSTRAPEVTPN
jgi:hypothetical protein